ncbi:MAG: hypothetical protein QOH47_2842 [Sphingomonadales bacterium]|jgi:hypothetical protein|nr:hypothetical protein [Sphingomonadales bacterium]
MSKSLYVALLALAAAILLYAEWHTDEVMVVLALLVVLAAALGLARPAAALATGIVLGAAIPLAHLASALSGLYPPPYQVAPPSPADWAVMAFLLVPALAAAYAAAWPRRHAAN